MLVRLALALALTALCPLGARASGGSLRSGAPAPPLTFDQLLQAPSGAVADWAALEGQVVVLEFWATWCEPCLSVIPHLNELARKFQGRVQFIAVTDEGEATVRAFLEGQPVEAWIGIDADESMFIDYSVPHIPYMVVVGRDGRVVGVERPADLTEEFLGRLVGGRASVADSRPPARPRAAVEPLPAAQADREDAAPRLSGDAPGVAPATPLLQASIDPARGGETAIRLHGSVLQGRGVTMKDALAAAFGIDERRILGVERLPPGRYDLSLVAPSGRSDLRQSLLRQAIEVKFGLTLRSESREADVLVLTSARSRTRALPESRPGTAARIRQAPGRIEGTNVDLGTLASGLEAVAGRTVVDSTGLTGRYDVEVLWDPDHPELLSEAVRRQLGLDLLPARRTIHVLLVESLGVK